MKNQTFIATRLQYGFSLVELMVAVTLGLIVLAAVSTVFVNSSKNYKTTDSLARLQENARTAMHFLTTDIRRAGYVGCQSSVDNVQIQLNGTKIKDVNLPLVAFTGTNASGTSSDTLTLQYLDLNTSVPLTASMQNETEALTIGAPHQLKQYDIVAVADCDSVDVFQITNNVEAGTTVEHTTAALPAPHQGNANPSLSKAYETSARIMRFNQLTYEVKQGAGGRLALFRGGDELVEGIENMQVLFGLRPLPPSVERRPERFVTVNNVPALINGLPDWHQVVAIRVGLLAYSFADTTTGELGHDQETVAHTVNDLLVPAAGDRRIRKTFLTTVETRNIR